MTRSQSRRNENVHECCLDETARSISCRMLVFPIIRWLTQSPTVLLFLHAYSKRASYLFQAAFWANTSKNGIFNKTGMQLCFLIRYPANANAIEQIRLRETLYPVYLFFNHLAGTWAGTHCCWATAAEHSRTESRFVDRKTFRESHIGDDVEQCRRTQAATVDVP